MGYFKTKNGIYCSDNYKVSARAGELIPSSNFSRYNVPNGMGLLPAPIELNNQIVTPTFRYNASDVIPRNIAPYSEDFSNYTPTEITVDSANVNHPITINGRNLFMDGLIGSVGSSAKSTSLNLLENPSGTALHTASLYVKAGTQTTALLYLYAAPHPWIWVDLSNGNYKFSGGSGGIEHIVDGIFRIWFTTTVALAAAATKFWIQPTLNYTSVNYTGDGSSVSLWVMGAQTIEGNTPGDYQGPSTTTPVGGSWPVDIYGTDAPLVSSGDEPYVNSGSPCFGTRDDGVRSIKGKSYQLAAAATYDLTTEDFILEWFARNAIRQTGYFYTKYDGSKGMYIDYLSAGSAQMALWGADGNTTINSGNLYFGNEWNFWQLIVNKNGYAQYSFNGVLIGTPVDVSGVGSLTSTAKATILDRWDLAAPCGCDFAYIAMYAKKNWLGTHNLPDFAAERHYQVTGLLPLSSRGKLFPVATTRASSGYIQKDTDAVPRLYYVGANYIRLERYTDLNGVEKVCELVESVAEENMLLRNNQWENAVWVKRGGATADHYTAETIDPLTTNWAALLTLGFESTPVDIYQSLAAATFTNDAVLAVSMWIKKKTATGTLVIANPAIAANGRWEIDVSGLPDYWIRIDRAFMNTYGTVVAEFSAKNDGAAGVQFYNKVDAVLEIYVWNPMQIENGSYQAGSDITETVVSSQSRAAEVYSTKLNPSFDLVTNISKYSEDFDSWGKTAVTVDSANINHPVTPLGSGHYFDGIIADAGAPSAKLVSITSMTENLTAGRTTFSFYGKAGSLNWLRITVYIPSIGTGYFTVYYDFSTGLSYRSGGEPLQHGMILEDGVYRCWFTPDDDNGAENTNIYLYLADAFEDATVSGDGTTVSLWLSGFQINTGHAVKKYVGPTTLFTQIGYDNELPGLISQKVYNRLLQSSTLETGWTARGTATADDNTTEVLDPFAGNKATKLTGLDVGGSGDFYYHMGNGTYPNSVNLAAGIWIKRISTTGTITFNNSLDANGVNGRWDIDCSLLPAEWIRITRKNIHLYGAVVGNEWISNGSGNSGGQIVGDGAAVRSCYIYNIQLSYNHGNAELPVQEFPITTTAATSLGEAKGSIQFDLLLPNATPLAAIEIMKMIDNADAANQFIFEVQTNGTITCTMDATGGSQRVATVAGDCADGLWHRIHLLWEAGRFIIRRDNVAGTNISATIAADIPDDLNLLTRLNSRIANIQLWNRAYYPGHN